MKINITLIKKFSMEIESEVTIIQYINQTIKNTIFNIHQPKPNENHDSTKPFY